jgi:hypothetical protein
VEYLSINGLTSDLKPTGAGSALQPTKIMPQSADGIERGVLLDILVSSFLSQYYQESSR